MPEEVVRVRKTKQTNPFSLPNQKQNIHLISTDCDVNCHKKCEKLTANLCGVNQKLIVEALSSVRKGKPKTLEKQLSNKYFISKNGIYVIFVCFCSDG